jgi:hypothetical protein
MSPVAAILTVALAGAAAPAAPALTVPPIVVDVALLTNVSPTVVSTAIEETQALFRSAGVQFIWRRGSASIGALRVIVSAEPGPSREGATPLGWLTFENGEPLREIHLSYANAEASWSSRAKWSAWSGRRRSPNATVCSAARSDGRSRTSSATTCSRRRPTRRKG